MKPWRDPEKHLVGWGDH